MLGVQLSELAHIGKSFWLLGLIVAGAVSASNPTPEVDTLELIRQVQRLRV